MKKLIALLLSLAMVLSLAACGGQPANNQGGNASNQPSGSNGNSGSSGGDVIKIGVVECLTGDNAAPGALCKIGVELANELHPTVTVNGVEIGRAHV